MACCVWPFEAGMSCKKAATLRSRQRNRHKIPENYVTKVVIKFDKIHRFARLFYGPATI